MPSLKQPATPLPELTQSTQAALEAAIQVIGQQHREIILLAYRLGVADGGIQAAREMSQGLKEAA